MTKKFTEHLDLAKSLWDSILNVGDIVIDATCGNGFDTLFLAKKILHEDLGFLYGYDIQKSAIENTYQRLQQENISLKNVALFHKSHEDFAEVSKNVKLIVYNLGYLPGFDKSITTRTESTIKSIENGLNLSSYISIMCYPGHSEGKEEKKGLLQFLANLDRKKWSICHYEWVNRPLSPSLIFIKNVEENTH